jgi:superfamily II DNA or RNA helicase
VIYQIATPVKMYIIFERDEISQLSEIKKALTYTNQSIAYQIKKTKESGYMYGEDWAANKVMELEQQLTETLLWEDEGGLYTRPGLLRYLNNRFEGKVENLVVVPDFKLVPWHKAPQYDLYPWQSEAVARLLGTNHGHIEAATGSGKSSVIFQICKETGLPTVISTPSASIARQLYEEAKYLFGKQKVGLFGDGKRELGKHILISVSKSLSLVEDPEEVETLKKYQVLLADESHLIPADQADKYCNGVLGHCTYRWFLSATQTRTDGKDLKLLSNIGPQVYNYSIDQATTDGVLAKLSFLVFNVKSDSRYDSRNMVKMNQEHIYRNMKIANIIADLSKQAIENNMPTLILIDEHNQEEILRNCMKVDFTYACGGSDTQQICQDFNDGKILCVVGTSAVSTGTNFKPVKLTINWQAGKSEIKVKQGPIGRSTRTDKRTCKTECKVVDFRIVNVPTLKRHTDCRVGFYKEVGPVHYANED